ncbi:PACE efflux transporter [Rhodobacteraceae bacterium F11138]|nr:PACE efflux transporter [Rhodobacteraceae bacterium F11138]
MRTTRDRIRHAISFEIIGLLLVVPLGAWAFQTPMQDIGIVAVVSSVLATGWNFVYNLLFDRTMLRLRGSTRKTIAIRVLHAVLFEIGLLLVLMPFIAWYLGISLMQALVMDLAFAGFYLLYAFCFNWAYDLIFPDPGARRVSATGG